MIAISKNVFTDQNRTKIFFFQFFTEQNRAKQNGRERLLT